jgi:hypothetical protein
MQGNPALQKLQCYTGSMNTLPGSLTHLSDQQLLTEVRRLADDERQATARLIASLVELDARRLYLSEGCPSLFTYCTQVLRLTEPAAYGRIEAARAAQRFPVILERLADGSVSLTAVGLLARHLTAENHCEVLDSARHKSKREVEHLVARLAPRPDVPASVRKLPTPKGPELPQPQAADAPAGVDAPALLALDMPPPQRPALVAPLAPERYQIKVTVGRETYEKLCRAKDLLRHTIPSGDPAAILDRALTLLVVDLEKRRLSATARPRMSRPTAPGSRHIPAEVKREVWARDRGQCAFVSANGLRCRETGGLEYHHVVPFAAGGPTVADNLRLYCRRHNAYEAEQYFGSGEPWLLREERTLWSSTNSVRPELRQAREVIFQPPGERNQIDHIPDAL